MALSKIANSEVDLWRLFQERAKDFATQPALSAEADHMTFSELFKVAERIVVSLAKAGIKEGDIVALALPNTPAFVPAFLALCKLSITVALVSSKYGESEWRSIQDNIMPASVITVSSVAGEWQRTFDFVRNQRPKISITKIHDPLEILSPVSRAPHANFATRAPSPNGVRLIKITSGSTGVPKGIALSAQNIVAEAENVANTLALTPRDRILAVVPLVHSYGFDLGVLAMLFSGAALLLRETFVPRQTFAELSSQHVTVFLGVPSMYRFFLETDLASTSQLSYIRYLLSCTAPLHPDLICAFNKKYHIPICQHYGSSETGAVTTHIPDAVLNRSTSVGMPMKNVEVKIMNEQSQELPASMEGEIVVKSGAVASGYVMGHPKSPSPFRDDHFWTGDLGCVDEAGFLYLHGRKDQIINVGGLKVSPQEVIRVLESFPAVREAAVLGVRGGMSEETVYAAVTLRRPATEKEILAFCSTRLADYKIPRRLEIREALPHSPSGKIKLSYEDIKKWTGSTSSMK